jgi:glycine cleavage system H lipoate-binding protein
MSVLLALLSFALVMMIWYLLARRLQPTAALRERPYLTYFQNKFGIELPSGYCFHPCHTWAVNERWELVRVGLDNFAANLFGKIDQIDVTRLNRWVRQGQKLMTITGAGISVDFPSPIEGVVTDINRAALENPELVTTQPFGDGWIALIKSPSFDTDQKNLLQGPMAASWIRSSIMLLREMCSKSPAFAQDGGIPLPGVLNGVPTELRDKIIREFLLTLPILPPPQSKAAV